MLSEEVFYDSLDEEEMLKDETLCVPLYTGDTPKCMLNQSIRRKANFSNKCMDVPQKEKKSYLTMYYQRVQKRQITEESYTGRAVCDSPKSDITDEDLGADGGPELDDFYEYFLAKRSEAKPEETSGSTVNDEAAEAPLRNEKLEMLKRRQNYGIKMSMKNRIRIQELRDLQKIKNAKF